MSMLVLRLRNIDTTNNTDWIYTNWEIATAKNFERSKIIFSEYEDRVNKSSKFVEMTLNPGTKYYARAQVVTNKGAHKWTNLDVWTHKAFDDVENQSDLPSRVNSPDITTDSIVNDHVPTGFYIICKEFAAIGDATHAATSYWIETLDGKVVWKNLLNEISKSKILVNDIILDNNKVYRIKAVFHASSGDSSQIATNTIYVNGKSTDANVIRLGKSIVNADFVSLSIDTTLNPYKNAKEVAIKIMAFNNGRGVTAYETVTKFDTPPYAVSIPMEKVKRNTIYLVMIKYDIENNWKHMVINTFK